MTKFIERQLETRFLVFLKTKYIKQITKFIKKHISIQLLFSTGSKLSLSVSDFFFKMWCKFEIMIAATA